MPLLENNKAVHLEFTRTGVHLLGKHSIACEEAKVTVYRAYIVGRHDQFIGVSQMDCVDDDSAVKAAMRLVDSHDVELWQMDRPVARFNAPSKQILRK